MFQFVFCLWGAFYSLYSCMQNKIEVIWKQQSKHLLRIDFV